MHKEKLLIFPYICLFAFFEITMIISWHAVVWSWCITMPRFASSYSNTLGNIPNKEKRKKNPC